MKIHVIALCYNEELILPYFLKHYGSFADKITIFDNQSTDNSVEIIKSFDNTEVIVNDSDNQISDLKYLDIKNNAWKTNTEYDWQIVVDMDEFVYHENLLNELEVYKLNNVTVVPTIGYNMVANTFPTNYNDQLYNKVQYGVVSPTYGKTCIFNPSKLIDINYKPGAHICAPVGNVVLGYPIIKLLHYKYFGFDHWKARNDMYATRLGENRDGYADAYLKWKHEITNESQYNAAFIRDKIVKVV